MPSSGGCCVAERAGRVVGAFASVRPALADAIGGGGRRCCCWKCARRQPAACGGTAWWRWMESRSPPPLQLLALFWLTQCEWIAAGPAERLATPSGRLAAPSTTRTVPCKWRTCDRCRWHGHRRCCCRRTDCRRSEAVRRCGAGRSQRCVMTQTRTTTTTIGCRAPIPYG